MKLSIKGRKRLFMGHFCDSGKRTGVAVKRWETGFALRHRLFLSTGRGRFFNKNPKTLVLRFVSLAKLKNIGLAYHTFNL